MTGSATVMPDTGYDEVLFAVEGRAGIITLNRPDAFNALTLDMVLAMIAQLRSWAADPAIELIVQRAAPGKAFCSGGDIRNLHDWGRAGDGRALAFFREEYRLDRLIKTYPKPVVSLINGIVMGGGVGISINGSHRVMTENAVFAMPEVGIGLFPDVGGTYFLPRLDGHIGTYLALTGDRLGGADCVALGLGTHFSAADQIPALTEALCQGGAPDAILASFAQAPGPHKLTEVAGSIADMFAAADVAAVLAGLDARAGEGDAWAKRQSDIIQTKSPTSLAIAARQMALGPGLDFDDCLRTEYRIVNRVLKGHDFYEGVRATIIDKDKSPNWQPARVGEVTPEMIDGYVAGLEAGELEFLSL